MSIHAYVLMRNHVHLLASPGRAQALPRLMQDARTQVCGLVQLFGPPAHGHTVGGLRRRRWLRARSTSSPACVTSSWQPVRAGLVAAPADYRWSSHRANACGDHDPVVTPHPLYVALAAGAEERQRVYRQTFGEPEPNDAVPPSAMPRNSSGHSAGRRFANASKLDRPTRRSSFRREDLALQGTDNSSVTLFPEGNRDFVSDPYVFAPRQSFTRSSTTACDALAAR